MQPSEITAHEIDRIGTKLRRETHDGSLRHFAIGADILMKPGFIGYATIVGSRTAAGLPRARAICRRHFPNGDIVLDVPHLRNEMAAYAYVEARVWRNGRGCPHCGVVGNSGLLRGKSTRIGVYKCYACRKPFTVKIGTIFEASHVPMHMWLQAIVLMCGSKKGISTNQLHRTLGVTLRTAWHMSHRLRLAMDESGSDPLGGEGQIVESEETYTVHKEGGPT